MRALERELLLHLFLRYSPILTHSVYNEDDSRVFRMLFIFLNVCVCVGGGVSCLLTHHHCALWMEIDPKSTKAAGNFSLLNVYSPPKYF